MNIKKAMGINLRKYGGSHLPVLIKIAAITNGPILELGGGIFSTPFLHVACFASKRELVTYENDLNCFDIVKQYACDFHKVGFVENWDGISIERSWDLAFIDHAPGERRKKEIARLANLAKYVVVHDTEKRQEHVYGLEEIYPLFKYRYDFRELSPHTSILSNFVDLKD